MNNVDLNHINHFILRKQHLTDDSKTDNIVQIAKDIGGLHSTSSTTPYLSLFARTNGAPRASPWYLHNPPSLKLRRVIRNKLARHPP
jgi:hypothetical protein